MYVVRGWICTGLANVTLCQPVADSLVNVAWARRWPSSVHRLPTCVPVFPEAL